MVEAGDGHITAYSPMSGVIEDCKINRRRSHDADAISLTQRVHCEQAECWVVHATLP